MTKWWRVVANDQGVEPKVICLLSSMAAAERWLKENIKAAHLTWDDERRIVIVQR